MRCLTLLLLLVGWQLPGSFATRRGLTWTSSAPHHLVLPSADSQRGSGGRVLGQTTRLQRTSAQGSHGIERHRTRQYGSFVGPIVAQKCDQKRPWTLSSTKKKTPFSIWPLFLSFVSGIPGHLSLCRLQNRRVARIQTKHEVQELMDSSHLRYHNELCWIWTRNQIASLTSLTYFTPPRGLGLVEALRIFLATFRLPGEADSLH